MHLDSRATIGLRNPRSVSTKVWPARGGLAIHWAGEKQDLAEAHGDCRARLRDWQRFHMDVRGWVDLAYNWVICRHGIVMVGRGWGVRSAANGTNAANDNYLAACWMGGKGDLPPNPGALGAFVDLILEIQGRGAGTDVRAHSGFLATGCPGSILTSAASAWRKVSPQAPATAAPARLVIPRFPLPAGSYFGPRSGPKESVSGYYNHRSDLARWQVAAGLRGDGLYGAKTASRARALQSKHRLVCDGLIGPRTWGAAWR